MVKSSKQFLISNETVNVYGFSVQTLGIDVSQFKKNPIMLWMHTRATGNKNDVLPLGHWSDIQVSGNSIYGTPIFDDSDSFARSIYDKVENGTLRMASAGLQPVEWNQNKTILLKSILQECSIVDVGANSDALAATLYNSQGGIINLSTLRTPDGYIQRLMGMSWNELDRSGKLLELKTKDFEAFAKKYNEEFGVYPKGYTPNNIGHSPYALNLFAKSYEELHHSDGLEKLKKHAPDLYREKHFQQFGKYPN